MSDSEVEFESADEGSKGDDGWEVEADFDLPDLEQSKPAEVRSSALSSDPDLVNADQQCVERKQNDTKPSRQNNTSDDAVPTLQSRLDKLAVDGEDTNSRSLALESGTAGDNATKQTNNQSGVSKNMHNS